MFPLYDMPRYQFYRLSFTLAVCCLPLVFWPLALKIFLVLTGCVIVCRILRKVYTSRIDIQDRCVFITGCDTGERFGIFLIVHIDLVFNLLRFVNHFKR